MHSEDPRECKLLGSKVKDFVSQRWECDITKAVAIKGVCAKFNQDVGLKKILQDTGEKLIFEASFNRYWECVSS